MLNGGYQLLHHGARALSRVERNGIRIDVGYLDDAIVRTESLIAELAGEIGGSPVMRGWRRRFESATKLGSRPQLAWVVENILEHTLPRTAKDQPKTDEIALSAVNHPFIKAYLRIIKLRKTMSTYLLGIRRETVDGFLHPFFNLHTVTTYRSSSDSPNFQNFPVRDPELKKLVRRAFIPRKGNVLLEVDYGGIEVRVAACYHQDPVMLEYIKDPTKDLHRDMAAQCYKIPVGEVTKESRYHSKNKWVFPQFYGSWYGACAESLWDAIQGVETKSGALITDILEGQGIYELGLNGFRDDPDPGSFAAHIKEVENHFWDKRFRVYKAWKDQWFADYQELGYLETLTGFVCRALMNSREAINYPVQGSAFHCLLWSLIRLVLHDLPRSGLKALVVGQVHDSIVNDVPEREEDQYKAMLQEIMVEKLMEAWKWIIVPLEVDFSTYPISWECER